MSKRIQRLVAAVAALSALALGGAVLAQAQPTPAPAPEPVSTSDGDNIQSGDQTTAETVTGSDGPGGHADEPGNANADHQFQGTE